MIALICAFLLIAALAWHAGYLHSKLRKLRKEHCSLHFSHLYLKNEYTDVFLRRLGKVEEKVEAAFAPTIVAVPDYVTCTTSWDAVAPLTTETLKAAVEKLNEEDLVWRRRYEEPCAGICPKCGEERVEWPAGVGFGPCEGCAARARARKYQHVTYAVSIGAARPAAVYWCPQCGCYHPYTEVEKREDAVYAQLTNARGRLVFYDWEGLCTSRCSPLF